MELLVAYQDDPAGSRMAKFLSKDMTKTGDIFCGEHYDLAIIPTPAISADWLDEKFDYDGFVFLSKHAAASGRLALTCHSTGNFSAAQFGGNDRQVAIPHPHLQKAYLQELKKNQSLFSDFEITIEATHHGPTALNKPSIFIEVGTTEKQWTDDSLCLSVATIINHTMKRSLSDNPVAICFGGTHYCAKFNTILLEQEYALGTITPKHALEHVDDQLFAHILQRNSMAEYALLDWSGLGPCKQKILNLLSSTNLEVIKL